MIELASGRIVDEKVRHFEVSTETRLGPGEQLFSFLAACIETFLAEEVAAQEQEQE